MAILKLKNKTTGEWEEIQAIKGEQGPRGEQGIQGPAGNDAKINNVNTLNIEAGDNITLEQQGNTLKINSTGGGGGGTSDYSDLTNKPQINSVTLSGNKSLNDLGIQPAGNYALESEIPTKTSQLTNDSDYITSETDPVFNASAAKNITSTDITNWNNKQDTLVSGTNIKTINNTSILGSGNISLPQVTDSYSASTTDSYSCNYVNGLNGKILWVNPNPTNNFGAQTISVDFSNCDMYELVYYQSITRTNRELSSGRIRVGKGSIATYGSGIIRAWDGSNTSLTFENASDNQYLIPAYIIGYKTRLFD